MTVYQKTKKILNPIKEDLDNHIPLKIGFSNQIASWVSFLINNNDKWTTGQEIIIDGGATTHPYPRASGVPNAKGRDPYYYAPLKIASVTGTTVTMNVGISSDTSVHSFDSATTNSVTSGPSAKINTLAFNTVDTITNGLNGLPTLVPTGVGTVII